MPKQIVTHRDAISYTVGRMTLAGGLTAFVTLLFLLSDLGTDPNALVPVGTVAHSSLLIAVGVSTLVSGALSYRSAILMRQLTLTRAELARISRTDPLTGLLNRRGFDDAAAPLLAQAAAAGQRVVALMCDIDRFKAINDRYGHDTGDRVLSRIGDILRDFAEANDMLIARHGGEEFAGLMIGVSDEEATRCALALCKLCSTEVAGADVAVPVTMSFGLAAHLPGGDLAALMRRADQALYRAKDLGRNCVVQIDRMEAVAAC
ncbi:GGDEF domain-containing protein [Rhodopseudomonas palustris]|uniref:GGDEF domain-containing protein n=1 Tax=Rhodopseudomonas palustris TaxID=1076 RepID=UPI002ACD5BA1|nr:GGDEF domain-containing protein [Rhodopseudomonas palustris]WQH00060.1 GGDEF domain-containing protein [Rhodopseudomonas palustris]